MKKQSVLEDISLYWTILILFLWDVAVTNKSKFSFTIEVSFSIVPNTFVEQYSCTCMCSWSKLFSIDKNLKWFPCLRTWKNILNYFLQGALGKQASRQTVSLQNTKKFNLELSPLYGSLVKMSTLFSQNLQIRSKIQPHEHEESRASFNISELRPSVVC